MESRTSQFFKPRRSWRRIWIIMVSFGAMVPIGLTIYFLTNDKAGLCAAAFGLLPFLYMLCRVLARGSGYSVGPEGVSLKHGRSKRLIPLSEIRGAAVLSEGQTRAVLKQYMAPAINGERAWDMQDYLSASRIYNYFTMFSTIPIVQETTARGTSRNIVKFGTKVKGRFVILKLAAGEEFLISPEDCTGFFFRLSSLVNLSDTSPSSSYTYKVDYARRKKLYKAFNWYRGITLVAFVVILVLVSVLRVYLNPEESGQKPVQEQSEALGWIDEETFRYRVHVQIETHITDPEERESEFLQALTAGNRLGLINQIIGWYCSETGLEPDAAEYQALHNVLDPLISRINPEFNLEFLDPDSEEAAVIMDYTGPDLKNSLKSLLDDALKTAESGAEDSING